MKVYGDEIGHPNTGRGLAEMNRRLGRGRMEDIIARRIAVGGACRVLEIGCGEGRVLLELRSLLPAAEFHGINEVPWSAMQGSESLRAIGDFYGIAPPPEPETPLPAIRFCDAAALPFPSEHFDLIFSQAALHFVKRKDRAIEEMIRVLKPGGEAHVHLDSTWPDAVDPCPRFRIADGNGLPTLEHIAERCGSLATVEWERPGGVVGGRITVLRLTKQRAGSVDLGLVLNEARSVLLSDDDDPPGPYYGFRSVFAVRRDG